MSLLGQVIWGSYDGDFKVKHQLQDVKRVLAAGRIFVAIHSDGTCTVVNRDLWQLRGAQPQQLCASDEKYALVLADGDVLVWDDAIGSPANRPKELAKSLMSKRVVQLQSTTKAFCAVFSDGEAIAFGDPLAGGDSGSTPLTDVKRLEASDKAFAALSANNLHAVVTGTTICCGEKLARHPGLLVQTIDEFTHVAHLALLFEHRACNVRSTEYNCTCCDM